MPPPLFLCCVVFAWCVSSVYSFDRDDKRVVSQWQPSPWSVPFLVHRYKQRHCPGHRGQPVVLGGGQEADGRGRNEIKKAVAFVDFCDRSPWDELVVWPSWAEMTELNEAI